MLSEIEKNALARLTSRLDGIRAAGVQKGANGMFVNPAIAAAVLDGEFERSSKSTWKQKVTLSLLLKFKQLQGEEKRREGINPLVEAAVQILLDQKLGLKIDPLSPLRFRDVSTEADAEAGEIRYLIQFATSYKIEKQPDEAVTDLLTVAMQYFIKPGDDTADAADTVELSS